MNISHPPKKIDLLEDLLLKRVHIKNDWDSIQQHFNKSYPLFFIEFIKNGIQLTTAEEQFLVLEKLGLNTKKIANLLKVLPESVHKSRYRLKKKLSNKKS